MKEKRIGIAGILLILAAVLGTVAAEILFCREMMTDRETAAVQEETPNLVLSEKMENNAPAYHLKSTKEELKEILFTSGQEEMIEEGREAEIEVMVNNVTDTISVETRASVTGNPYMAYGGYVVLRYLDITLSAGMLNNAEEVEELYDPVWITFEIPEEYRNTNPMIKRFYRLYNGSYLCDLDSDEDTLTVAMTGFGTFALLMKDMYVDGILMEPCQEEDTGWYRKEDGRIEACTNVQMEDGESIYLNEFGKTAKGWQITDTESGRRIYADPETGYLTKEGWHEIDGEWYYFDELNTMVTGWFEADGKRYYAKYDGRIARSETITADGSVRFGIPWGEYTFDENGAVLE